MSELPWAEAHPKTQRVCALIERLLEPQRLHELEPAALAVRLRAGLLGPAPARLDSIAEEFDVASSGGPIGIRALRPPRARASLLYFHGGGFIAGSRARQDERLWRRAQAFSMDVYAAGYRLAPEHPFPAAHQDACAALRWFLRAARGPLFVQGDSAGANLALAAIQALLGSGEMEPGRLAGLILNCGVYSMAMSPEARAWGLRPLIINTPLIEKFHEAWLQGQDGSDPRASPLLGEMRGLPASLVIAAGADPLLSDSLRLMSAMRVAGVTVDEYLAAGAPHTFDALLVPEAQDFEARLGAFIESRMAAG